MNMNIEGKWQYKDGEVKYIKCSWSELLIALKCREIVRPVWRSLLTRWRERSVAGDWWPGWGTGWTARYGRSRGGWVPGLWSALGWCLRLTWCSWRTTCPTSSPTSQTSREMVRLCWPHSTSSIETQSINLLGDVLKILAGEKSLEFQLAED